MQTLYAENTDYYNMIDLEQQKTLKSQWLATKTN